MKLIFVLLIFYLNLFHFNESKKCRVILDDQFLVYVDKRVMPITEQFSLDDFIFEQVDDDNVIMGGYGKCLKGMDPKLPLQMSLSTQFYAMSTWNEGPIRLNILDMCKEMVNPDRFWYNMTKLFKPCPPKVGDIWPVERQTINVLIDLPPSLPFGMWKVFGLFTQGIFGMEKTRFGFGFKLELVSVN